MNFEEVLVICPNGHKVVTMVGYRDGEKPGPQHLDRDIQECSECHRPYCTVQTMAEVTDPAWLITLLTARLESRNKHDILYPIERVYETLVQQMPGEYHLIVAKALAVAPW